MVKEGAGNDRAAGAPAARHGRRFVLFSGIGLANTATDFAVYIALMFVGLAPVFANFAGFLVANGQSYFLNAGVTFRENGRGARRSFGGYLRFAAAHVVSLLISTAIIVAFADLVGAVAAKAGAALLTLVMNYAAAALFVFRPDERAP